MAAVVIQTVVTVVLLTFRVVSGLTAAEQQEFLDIHNSLRAGEGSSNMEILVWDTTLETFAQQWADGCQYEHGQNINSSTLQDLNFGQNLYATTAALDLTAGVQAWFDEKADFDYDSNTCATGKVCGHYTQVVWATTNRIGCGYKVCPSLSNGWSNAAYIVCNYAPGGNVGSNIPYLKGAACTQCKSGQFYCNNGLCDNSCTAPSTNCVCSAACQNCGIETSDCRCQCGTGWWGVDCSVPCADTNSNCGASPGWPSSWCSPDYQYVLDQCPVLCSLCVAGTPETCDTTAATETTEQSSTTSDPNNVTAAATSTAVAITTTLQPSTNECHPRCAGSCSKFGKGKCDVKCVKGFTLTPKTHICRNVGCKRTLYRRRHRRQCGWGITKRNKRQRLQRLRRRRQIIIRKLRRNG